MDNEYWVNKWKSNDIAFHEQYINGYLMTYIDELNLHSSDNIFVPLCGKTKDMLWLAEKGFHVFGIELSPIACQDFFIELNITPHIVKKNKFLSYQCNNIQLLCGDLFDLTTNDLPAIQAVYDCKALIALPPDVREKYVTHILDCLGTKIKILLLTRESNCKVSPPPFPITKNEVELLYSAYFNVKQLKHFQVVNIPENIIKKGYTEMAECVYLISEKTYRFIDREGAQ